jgi:hypothetical protein
MFSEHTHVNVLFPINLFSSGNPLPIWSIDQCDQWFSLITTCQQLVYFASCDISIMH